MTKPTITDLLPLARAVYERHSAGCCLHIVLDDGNIGDDSVEFCRAYAAEQGHPECERLANLLALASKTQRLKVGRAVSGARQR